MARCIYGSGLLSTLDTGMDLHYIRVLGYTGIFGYTEAFFIKYIARKPVYYVSQPACRVLPVYGIYL